MKTKIEQLAELLGITDEVASKILENINGTQLKEKPKYERKRLRQNDYYYICSTGGIDRAIDYGDGGTVSDSKQETILRLKKKPKNIVKD